ncbi:glycosyltransferase family 39 protein [Ferruginibacter sp.]|uniref:ArnT family glycosyltransferase n=1 Tax=Ferruginibacter sp. TaxID=1940288 RepID=UPI0026592425|nr:glycosyltransferase family 39 protein [Ferruginibacter sp.]
MLLLYAACNFYCITRLSVTGDESNYYKYGINILKNEPQKKLANGVPVYNSQMPIVAINALTRAIPQLFNPALKHNSQQTLTDVTIGRIFSVISALLLACYVLVWSTKLYGRRGGFFSLTLYMLCPNILAHSQMVGTDVYSFLVCTATCYYAWQFNRSRQMKYLLLVSLALGIGQISKQSLLLLYPVVIGFLMLQVYQDKLLLREKIWILFRQTFIIAIISLLVINTGFLFNNTGKTLKEYHFISSKFKNLQQQFSFANAVPMPLPEPYVLGFDYVSFNAETPPGIDGLSSYGSGTFLGQAFTGQRIWYYYSICFLYKLPIPFLIIFFAAIAAYWINRKRSLFMHNEIFLLLPVAFIFVSFSLFNTMYLGIKNVLFLLPLLFIFCGSLVSNLLYYLKPKLFISITCTLLIWEGLSVASYFPHFLPYTNEFIYNKKDAFKIFGDANIYFQEGWILAKEYLDKHPDIQFEPQEPVHGKVMVSLEKYFDYWHDGKMKWLTNLHLEPVSHFDSQYLIFDVP